MASLNISPPIMGFTVNKPVNALGTGGVLYDSTILADSRVLRDSIKIVDRRAS